MSLLLDILATFVYGYWMILYWQRFQTRNTLIWSIAVTMSSVIYFISHKSIFVFYNMLISGLISLSAFRSLQRLDRTTVVVMITLLTIVPMASENALIANAMAQLIVIVCSVLILKEITADEKNPVCWRALFVSHAIFLSRSLLVDRTLTGLLFPITFTWIHLIIMVKICLDKLRTLEEIDWQS